MKTFKELTRVNEDKYSSKMTLLGPMKYFSLTDKSNRIIKFEHTDKSMNIIIGGNNVTGLDKKDIVDLIDFLNDFI